ncbi:hypothetical protein [Amycolatopsis sp. WQ 127309]|uniref:hypothetical protein n=1 Tax=Amycolatopsis sp. WQ 127309 TaxID=2932773 RepID=UPI001FF28A5B|nr:hypothetical protein [Amycolatopsis sp. WQ 127309]UOZ09903.1 hypothetical protein MUY22_17180 [Amycolatopsis sp. WQ 127309]
MTFPLIRLLGPADLPACADLAAAVVLESFDRVASISTVLVAPRSERRGLGRAITRHPGWSSTAGRSPATPR